MEKSVHDREKRKSEQVAIYDKIFREISPLFLSVLIDRVLKLDIADFVELKDKLQVTRQTETDTLRKVTDRDGNTYILHIEIESKNDSTMAARMADYFTTLHLIYKLPVKQYVIYIGEGPCRIPDKLDLPGMRFNYTLISISKIPHRMFLEAAQPEVQMLALLGDLEGESPTAVTRQILEGIAFDPAGQTEKHKRFSHLRMLSQLRKFDLDTILEEAMLTLQDFFKEERDPFFKRGLKRGMERGKTEVIRNLITTLGSTNAEIARIAGVPVDVVQNIRAAMEQDD